MINTIQQQYQYDACTQTKKIKKQNKTNCLDKWLKCSYTPSVFLFNNNNYYYSS